MGPRIQLSFAEELFLQTGYTALAAKEFSNTSIHIAFVRYAVGLVDGEDGDEGSSGGKKSNRSPILK